MFSNHILITFHKYTPEGDFELNYLKIQSNEQVRSQLVKRALVSSAHRSLDYVGTEFQLIVGLQCRVLQLLTKTLIDLTQCNCINDKIFTTVGQYMSYST